jgi:hemerythrin
MTLLTWQPEFSVGVEAVDFEHREMIDLINKLYEEMEGKMDADSIERFLGDIHATISAHFALEERMMRRAKYPEYEAHKNDHEDLLDQVRDLMDIFVASPEKGVLVLQKQMSAWFESHFSTFDARLHGQLDMPHH